MAIKIGGDDVIDNNRRGAFSTTKLGTFTKAQLEQLQVVGDRDGAMVYCSDIKDFAFWDASRGEWSTTTRAGAGVGGSTFEPGNGFRYHIFTAPGPFTVTKAGDVAVFAVGGGGAGGSNNPNNIAGGGGGAGGVVQYETEYPTGTYTVQVGNGGAATPSSKGNPGSDTIITRQGEAGRWEGTIIAKGGGGGGAVPPPYAGKPGGSGGGGGYSKAGGDNVLGTVGGSPITNGGTPGMFGGSFGQPGGTGVGSPGSTVPGAGGGGASGIGGQCPPIGNGSGGPGMAAFRVSAQSTAGDLGVPGNYGTPGPSAGRWFAGGGGGNDGNGTYACNGGVGGGGKGSGTPTSNSAGQANTGGGGGAAAYNRGPKVGRPGGSGIVIFRYPTD